MKSTILKIWPDHDAGRFRYPSDGSRGLCTAHGKGDPAACSGAGVYDVLLERADGPMMWAACEAWFTTNADAVEHHRRYGFAE